MKLNSALSKWKWTIINLIGGLLIGAGVADCIIATNGFDLDQIARGLTIFSAGVTILVVLDSAKTQKETEMKQKEVQEKLERIEKLLIEMKKSQKTTSVQLDRES